MKINLFFIHQFIVKCIYAKYQLIQSAKTNKSSITVHVLPWKSRTHRAYLRFMNTWKFFFILFSFAIISSGFLFILSRSIILDSKNTHTSTFEVEKWSFSWIINGTLLFDQKQNRFSILNKLWLWISISFEVPFAVFNKTTTSEFLILKVKCGINNSK